MALWECAECTTTYAVGLPKCPQCGSTIRVNDATQPLEEEQDMPKITVHGGPSIEGHVVDPETSEVTPIEPEEGEDVSAGTSSSTSSETPSKSTEPSEKPAPSPARPTANRSGKARTASSTARPTDGVPADGTSETADK
ncbi:hypothetical protein DV517_62280 [Streptomyces sp. S816]|uniref:hypothetical protein n=1 Tax=Streptomyces sp. S816 TaxID=2283197 RepID=UPI00109CD443|nr:hypothetical protein [Streptomyces sp. S816]TGZ14745.1 hypothetical protein DV517_62280 [Streptomyces sp. S816]